MKTKQVIGIIVGIVGVVAIYFSLKEYSGIGATLGVLLTAFGALYPFIFKDKQKPVVVLSKDYLHELAGEEIALRDKTIEELRQQLAEKDLPDYKEAVKPYVDEGNYAKAIELVNPDGAAEEAAEEAAEKYIFQAQLYIAGYQFKEAGEHYRKAVEIFPSYENTFAAAEFYKDLNCFNEAKEYWNRCLDMDLSPAQRAGVQNNLGLIFRQSNDYPEAEKAYSEALAIKRTLADEDPQTYKPALASTLGNLGNLHKDKGEYEQAATYYKESLEIYRELAKKDPDTYNPYLAGTLNNLGLLHYNLKDYGKAKGYHKEALQLRRGLAAKDPRTYNSYLATSLNNLGIVYKNMKRYEEAEKCYTEALSIQRELAGTNPQAYNPGLARTLGNLGIFYDSKAEPDYAKAEVYYKECLAIRREFAAEHLQAWNPDLADTLANMAVFYQDYVPDKELSIRHAQEAIEILDQCSNDSAMVRKVRDRANLVLEEWKDRQLPGD